MPSNVGLAFREAAVHDRPDRVGIRRTRRATTDEEPAKRDGAAASRREQPGQTNYPPASMSISMPPHRCCSFG